MGKILKSSSCFGGDRQEPREMNAGWGLVPSTKLGTGWFVPVLPSKAESRAESGASPWPKTPLFHPKTRSSPKTSAVSATMERNGRNQQRGEKKTQKTPQKAPKPNPEAPFGVGGGAQRKKSLSQSWGAGSWCSTCPARNASLCAYLQGAGTRMVPGQFQ